jgi:hypothetical protein
MKPLVQAPPEFFGRTIFAEDIRLEKTGQFTIVGMFPGGIEVENLPAVLPRMAMLVEFQWRLGALKETARLAAYMPGMPVDEPIWETTVLPPEPDPPALEKITLAERDGPFPGELISRGTSVVNMANIQVPRSGMLQVRAFVADKVFAIGGLYFSAQNSEPVAI